MRSRTYRICKNCVMDTSDSKITFDEDGVCDHCTTFYEKVLTNWHTDERGWHALENIVEKIKRAGSGKNFDCIIGMSGGSDSSGLEFAGGGQQHRATRRQFGTALIHRSD